MMHWCRCKGQGPAGSCSAADTNPPAPCCTVAAQLFENEIFGPVAAVSIFDEEDEVIARANNTMAGLVAYFYTNDFGRTIRVGEVRVGRVEGQ